MNIIFGFSLLTVFDTLKMVWEVSSSIFVESTCLKVKKEPRRSKSDSFRMELSFSGASHIRRCWSQSDVLMTMVGEYVWKELFSKKPSLKPNKSKIENWNPTKLDSCLGLSQSNSHWILKVLFVIAAMVGILSWSWFSSETAPHIEIADLN